MNNNKVHTVCSCYFFNSKQQLWKQPTVCLTRSVSFKLIYSCLLRFSSLTPPQPDPRLFHGYTNELLCGLSCAFSRCFTASPYTNPAVILDNAEHLPLSPPAKSKRGDLFPPFICNVMSMYSLLVTELEKMVDLTVWENPWGFSRDQGTLSWQLEPKKTSFSSRCQPWRFWIASPEGSEEVHILVRLGLEAIWVSRI